MTGVGIPGIMTAGRLISPVLLAAFWFSGGCAFMDWQVHRNSFERRDLMVADVYPAGNARMVERSGQEVYVLPCPETPMKFIPGMHVKEIRYAQMAGCKLIKYFDYDMRPDGRIQLGEIADVR